jgi:hypothetical protein
LREKDPRMAVVHNAKKGIEGAMGGVSVVALWLFFVR